MRRSGGVVPTSFAFLLAALLPGAVRAELPQSGFAPNLAVIGIRDIQRQLRVHGYDPGPDSGVMDDTTRAAILAYQHDYGLREDGIAGPALQNMLHFLRRRPAAPAEAADDSEQLPAPLAALTPPQAAPPPPAPPPAEISDDAMPPSAPPAEAADDAPPPPAPLTGLIQPPAMPPPPAPPVADFSDGAVVPPAPLAALLQPPVAPPSAATIAPTALYPPIIAPPSAAPRKQASQAARVLPAIPPMGDIASLAPPPPPSPEPAKLPDPLAVVAIAMPSTPAFVAIKSPYPDPLAAIAIQMPAVAPPPKNEEPLPALAFPPPIRMPAKTTAFSSHAGPQLVAEPRIPVSSAPLGTDPAHKLPAPAFVPPPFSTAPTDAPELAGDLYVRQVQEYLKQLGYFSGEPNGVLDWATVQALVKFDASGAGPSSVIADPKHLDEIWIARLKTALAAKGAPPP